VSIWSAEWQQKLDRRFKEVSVRRAVTLLAMGPLAMGLASGSLIGCKNTPPPAVQVPSDSGGNPYSTYNHEPMKPLPPSAGQPAGQYAGQPMPPSGQPPMVPPPPGDAAPQLPAPPSISQSYIDAYDRVGRPRLFVLIDRPDQPVPALVPGDYDLIERVVRDTLSAGGTVATVPPAVVHDKLSATQIRDALNTGGNALSSAGAALHADVLIELKVAPAAGQTQINGTARNARDGQALASVVSTINSGSPRSQIDFASRLLGERMINGLADSWERMSQPPATAASPAPAASQTSAPTPPTPAAPISAPPSPTPSPTPATAPPLTTPPPPPAVAPAAPAAPAPTTAAPATPAPTPGTQPAHP
jgi:hypothetical protein